MDMLLDMCKKQGYVPQTCELKGEICWGLMQQGQDPCDGCNADRLKCKGRPKKEVKQQ